jgi:hypothetical protein
MSRELEGAKICALSWGELDLGLVGFETLLFLAHLYLGASGASSVAEKRSDGDFVMVDVWWSNSPTAISQFRQ